MNFCDRSRFSAINDKLAVLKEFYFFAIKVRNCYINLLLRACGSTCYRTAVRQNQYLIALHKKAAVHELLRFYPIDQIKFDTPPLIRIYQFVRRTRRPPQVPALPPMALISPSPVSAPEAIQMEPLEPPPPWCPQEVAPLPPFADSTPSM